jgi:putative methionine-R-sulfoxide reductase with GAF domain
MSELKTTSSESGPEQLPAQAASLMSGQQDLVANAADLSALLFYALG